MTSATALATGCSLGIVSGFLAGHDLVRSLGRTADRPGTRAAFGLARRMALLGGVLVAALPLGGFAWAGAAAGYLAAFAGFVGREALIRGR